MTHGKFVFLHHRVSFLRFFQTFLLGLVLFGLLHCGGASPPVGIPSPVSSLMTVSNPDTNGNVTLNGAPGAVLPGAVVSAANTSQTSSAAPWEKILWGVALAQTASTQADTVAAPDGSFQLILVGQVGETVQVVQTVGGQTSPPTDLVIQGTVVDLGVKARGLAIDESSGTAFITAGPDDSGLIFKLNLNSFQPLTSKPPPNYSFSGFPSIGDIAVDSLAQRGFAVAPEQNALLVFDLAKEGGVPVVRTLDDPLTVRILPEAATAVIGLGSNLASIAIADSQSGAVQCSFLLTHPVTPTLSHVATPFLSVFQNATSQATIIALSQFSDGSWMLSRIPWLGCDAVTDPIDKVLLSSSLEPGGLGVVDSGSGALVSDTKGNQVFALTFKPNNSSTIAVGHGPQGIAVDESKETAFIVNNLDNSISHLDLNSSSLQNLIGVGLGPSQISLDTSLNLAVVLSELDATVVIVDLSKTLQ